MEYHKVRHLFLVNREMEPTDVCICTLIQGGTKKASVQSDAVPNVGSPDRFLENKDLLLWFFLYLFLDVFRTSKILVFSFGFCNVFYAAL